MSRWIEKLEAYTNSSIPLSNLTEVILSVPSRNTSPDAQTTPADAHTRADPRSKDGCCTSRPTAPMPSTNARARPPSRQEASSVWETCRESVQASPAASLSQPWSASTGRPMVCCQRRPASTSSLSPSEGPLPSTTGWSTSTVALARARRWKTRIAFWYSAPDSLA